MDEMELVSKTFECVPLYVVDYVAYVAATQLRTQLPAIRTARDDGMRGIVSASGPQQNGGGPAEYPAGGPVGVRWDREPLRDRRTDERMK